MSDAEGGHGLRAGFLPPGAGELEALWDEVAVAALDLTGADGQPALASGGAAGPAAPATLLKGPQAAVRALSLIHI